MAHDVQRALVSSLFQCKYDMCVMCITEFKLFTESDFFELVSHLGKKQQQQQQRGIKLTNFLFSLPLLPWPGLPSTAVPEL